MSSTNKDEDEEIDPNKVLQADNQNKDYFSNDDIDNESGDNDKFKDFNFEDIKKTGFVDNGPGNNETLNDLNDNSGFIDNGPGGNNETLNDYDLNDKSGGKHKCKTNKRCLKHKHSKHKTKRRRRCKTKKRRRCKTKRRR